VVTLFAQNTTASRENWTHVIFMYETWGLKDNTVS
jgi:hypothetical protein